VAQDLRQLARGELSRSTGAVAELGKPPQHLLHRPPFPTVNSRPQITQRAPEEKGLTVGITNETTEKVTVDELAGWVWDAAQRLTDRICCVEG
jgi:hypothetical protein